MAGLAKEGSVCRCSLRLAQALYYYMSCRLAFFREVYDGNALLQWSLADLCGAYLMGCTGLKAFF